MHRWIFDSKGVRDGRSQTAREREPDMEEEQQPHSVSDAVGNVWRFCRLAALQEQRTDAGITQLYQSISGVSLNAGKVLFLDLVGLSLH